ncbi:MAG: DUF4258 domain-containing protein [Tepidisphaeraceae bacterium]|jgi:hypothetical protein
MDEIARRALRDIQECIAADRVTVLAHFVERMDLRGLFWMDVVEVIESPEGVRGGGPEEFGRPKWIIDGTATDGLKIEIVCVIDREESQSSAVFVTIYWQD